MSYSNNGVLSVLSILYSGQGIMVMAAITDEVTVGHRDDDIGLTLVPTHIPHLLHQRRDKGTSPIPVPGHHPHLRRRVGPVPDLHLQNKLEIAPGLVPVLHQSGMKTNDLLPMILKEE